MLAVHLCPKARAPRALGLSPVTVSRATRYGAEEHEQDVSQHPLAKHCPADLAPRLRAGALQTSLDQGSEEQRRELDQPPPSLMDIAFAIVRMLLRSALLCAAGAGDAWGQQAHWDEDCQ